MPGVQCHNLDLYGISKVCDAPPVSDSHRRDDDHRPAAQQGYVTVLPPIVAPYPDPFPNLTPAPAADPEPVTPYDGPHRELTLVDNRLHRIHLLLNDRHATGDISPDNFDEEIRLLTTIEHREQSEADTNGGYLTVAEENSLLQELQDTENEILGNLTSQSSDILT